MKKQTVVRPSKFMKTVFDKHEIANYEKIEKDFSKRQLAEDLARVRMEKEVMATTFSNLRFEIHKLVDLGFVEFQKEYTKEDESLFPIIFKILQGYSFWVQENAKVFEGHNRKEVFWDYWLNEKGIEGKKIPEIQPYEKRKNNI